MKKITYEKFLKKKILKNIFLIVGNDEYKKNECKNIILNSIKNKYKKINFFNLLLNKKFKIENIKKYIIYNSLFSNKIIILLNIIENIKEIINILKKILIISKNNNIFFIFKFEYKFNLNNFLDKSIIISCNKKNNYLIKDIYFFKNIKNENINNFIKSFKEKNLKKNIYFFRKIKKDNIEKKIILNIIFLFLIKQKNFFKYNLILNIIKKYELKIKKNKNILWSDIELISIKIIKL